MDAETREVLTEYVKNFVAEKNCGCSHVKKEAQTEQGLKNIVFMLFELMEQYKDFTPSACMGQIEVTLNDIDVYGTL